MPLSMQHWNGHQLCAIDTETTGLNPNIHQIWELCILPLDSNANIRRDVLPFHIKMKPEYPDTIDWKSDTMKGNKSRIDDATTNGFSQEKGADLLRDWWEKLKLPWNKYGSHQCQIIPLGQNYRFDFAFLQSWLGTDEYYRLFSGLYVDTMVIAQFINDRAAMAAEKVPHSKVNLQWLSHLAGHDSERRHDALHDSIATAAVYRHFLKTDFPCVLELPEHTTPPVPDPKNV